MATYYKYEKYLKYINGVPTEEYKQGNIMGTGEYSSKKDCEEGAIYRWVDSGETICDGYKLCVKLIKLKSTDGSVTWITTSETRAGQVVDLWSTECGAVILYKWNPTSNTRCNGYSEEAEYAYLVSYTMGTTWQDVVPRQTKWETTDVFTDECFLASEPFTFTFDAGEEGAELDLNTKMSTLYSYGTEDGPYGPPYSPDVDKYVMYWYTNGFTKYAIDWGDNEELVLDEFVSYYNQKSDPYWKTSPKPDNPFINLKITGSVDLGNHIYRTGGIKTVKIWGNISYFGCKQVKEFIHWGYPMFNTLLSITPELLLALLIKKGTQVCDPSTGNCHDYLGLTYAKTEGYDNFNKVETTFTGTTFGTMYLNTFNYLTYFDMSNSPNIVNPNPYSKFNKGRLKTFIADNCTSLQWTPDLKYLGKNDNSSKLTSISFKGCTNLKYVRPIEMYHVYISGGALTRGLDLTTGNVYKNGVFEDCLNIEEFNFGYDVYVNSIDFKPYTKLKKITGNLLMDGTIYHGQGQFYLFCKGLPELEDIENLTLKGSCFGEAFMDCPKIKYPCTTIVRGSSSSGYAYLQYMYSNTGIVTLDISKIYLNETDPTILNCNGMFENCLELTKVTNSLQVNLHVMSRWSFGYMFRNCSNLTTISPIFKEKTTLPNMSYMFYNCNLTSLPNSLFNYTYEGTEVNIPYEMFANNIHLVNYPIVNLIPMWKLPAFFFGEITLTRAFKGCTKLGSSVPYNWGGYSDLVPVKIKVLTTNANETVVYPNYNVSEVDDVVMKSADGTNKTSYSLLFASPGTYEVDIYIKPGSSIRIPILTSEIVSWGNAQDINTLIVSLMATKVTYLPYGEKLFSTVTQFSNSGVAYSYEWFLSNTITDVADNLLANCGNVTRIDGSNGLGAFDMNLSDEKYTTILSRLTNLERIHYLFKKLVSSTCGIFNHNPALTNISSAFANKLIEVPVDVFDNCPNLVNVSSVFTLNTTTTTMPSFNGCKLITNFSHAFSGCTNLTGNTPVDENGYKLWERAGKPGYPETINGERCFRGCTQLDDYNEIPDNWK